MIFNTRLEFFKFDKKQINIKNKEVFISFLNECKEKEIDSFQNKNFEFNQLEFYNSFRGKNEDLDKFLDYLNQEYNQYNIDGKSLEEIKLIICQYFENIPNNFSFQMKLNFISRTFNLKKIMNIKQIAELKEFLYQKEKEKE